MLLQSFNLFKCTCCVARWSMVKPIDILHLPDHPAMRDTCRHMYQITDYPIYCLLHKLMIQLVLGANLDLYMLMSSKICYNKILVIWSCVFATNSGFELPADQTSNQVLIMAIFFHHIFFCIRKLPPEYPEASGRYWTIGILTSTANCG